MDAWRRARQRACLRLPLSQIAPGRVAAAVAELARLRGDVDHARARDATKSGNGEVVAHAGEPKTYCITLSRLGRGSDAALSRLRRPGLACVDLGALAGEAGLVPRAGVAGGAAAQAIGLQMDARAGAARLAGLADSVAGPSTAADLVRSAGLAPGAAIVVQAGDACAVAEVAILKACDLVEAMESQRAFGIVGAGERARLRA